MKLSSRADYGLRAILELALLYSTGQPVQVKDIAERQEIPEDYLGQLMVALRRAGLVRSVRGPSGGYTLARPPRELTLTEVIEALEGPLTEPSSPDLFAGGAASSAFVIAEAWARATSAAREVLDSITIEDLCQRQRDLAAALTYHI